MPQSGLEDPFTLFGHHETNVVGHRARVHDQRMFGWIGRQV
jgi:hypothetical protein